MQLPQIRIQSEQAIIQLNIEPPQQSIQQPKAKLDIQQPKPELSINTTPSQLTIDQTLAWEALNQKSSLRFGEEIADKGYEAWLSGLARATAEGEELLKIENGGNAISSISKRNSEGPELHFNIGWIPPFGSVKLQYEPSKVEIDWKVNRPINKTEIEEPIINYEPGNTTISMKQYQSVTIDFEHLKYVGIQYEQEI
ncbi:DUF6470 family protein [Bacillus spongiae]|uniref:DUF6470 family protein n=1 Tax=Bacillus spongiae TaxID=2683610 RepID=A0ABU8HEJ7_9BACI